MTFSDFVDRVDERLNPSIVDASFRRIARGTWTRRRGDDLNVIWIQEHSTKALCCVNLGIHYSFIPKVGTEDAVQGDDIEQPECEIRMRLASAPSAVDQWWPLSSEAVEQVSSLIVDKGIVLFDRYRLDGEIINLDPHEIEHGRRGLLSQLTNVRACLLLARVHEHRGNCGKAIEAANVGIRVAGMAVGPKKALSEILRRCARSQ